MLRRLYNSCLLKPSDVTASQPDLQVIGSFNPGAIATDFGVVLLVRIAEQPLENRRGYAALPRWDLESGRVVTEWISNDKMNPVDIRVLRLKETGLVRLNFISYLQVYHSRDGRTLGTSGAAFKPETPYEEFGVEDPRIVRLNDRYYITYVAVSRHGVATALASTQDFKTFKRHGIIFPPENKDVLLFPEKIDGKYWALHRPNGSTPFTRPEMWTATSPDLFHWGDHHELLGGDETWDVGRIGGGTPPLRTHAGWLELYHGNSKRQEHLDIGTYSGAALLLDADNPRRILGRSGAIFLPETDFEREGFVPNVVFPTGIVEQDGKLLVYYGAADTVTGVVEFSLEELLGSLTRAPKTRSTLPTNLESEGQVMLA